MKKTVILISGKAGMGKSHYAQSIKEIQNKFGKQTEITSFATAVKNPLNPACFEMFKCRSQDLTPEIKEIFRPVLQAYGQAGRAIDKNYGVNKTKEIINNSSNDVSIIDDCRFENELYAFDEFNTIKIRINKPSVNKNVNQDISETGLDHISDDEFDILITKENSEPNVNQNIIDLLKGFE